MAELVLNPVRNVFEVLIGHLKRKGENVYYEEGVIRQGAAFPTALQAIEKEKGKIEAGSCLTIVDPYFTTPDDLKTQNTVKPFLNWVKKKNFHHVLIYTDAWCSCFAKELLNSSICSICPIDNCIHDRFWIFNEKGTYTTLMVGTSLSGFGKKYFVVQKLSEDNQKELLHDLWSLGVYF